MQVDSGAKAEEGPRCCALAQGTESGIPCNILVRARGLLCISSALAPSVLLSPGTALVGPVTPPGLVHAILFTLLFPPENFYLSFKAQLKDLPLVLPRQSGAPLLSDPRALLCAHVCFGYSLIPAPGLRPHPCSPSASFSATSAHSLTS